MEILAAVLGTALVVLVALNVTSGEKKLTHEIRHLYAAGDEQFRRSMGNLLGPGLRSGNAVTALANGDEIFPAMLEAIRSARRTITFETFIYWSGRIGEEFARALAERAGAGVRVHVLLDWVGSSKMDQDLIDLMTDAGVEVERYHPLRWYNLGRLNNRTHRKLLVVDGETGFTGGVGISDDWLGHAEDPEHWRDMHYRVRGPVVNEMQAAFMDNWMKTRALVLHGDDYFPHLEPEGDCFAQMFRSSPGEGSESVRLMFLLSIASAVRTVRISAAYFVPDDLSVETIVAACERGVKVEVVVPGKWIDQTLVRRASRGRWGPLLEAGVEIYEFQPTMYHCKVMIIDEVWTTVGSTNFDNRSFRLNDEANLNILDADFARAQVEQFEADKARSRRITLEEWRNRPARQKAREWAAGLLRSQL